MTDATRLTRCPCGWRGTLGECEVLGADDGRVFCPRCFREFEPVAVAVQGNLFGDDENDLHGV